MSIYYNVIPMATESTASVTWGTNSGTSISFSVSDQKESSDKPSGERRETKNISAKLYFSYVKSKMGEVEKEKFKKNAQKLQTLIKQAQDIKQVGLAEQLGKRLQVVVAEMEMAAYGIDKWIDPQTIYKFKDAVKDKTIDFALLQNFPRTVPASIRAKVTKLQKAGIFDEYWVLFNNPKKEVAKTIKQEKDPIIFGKLISMPTRYYFIADWVDAYCDLTLDQFVDEMKKTDPEYLPNQLPEIDEKFVKSFVTEVRQKLGSSMVPVDNRPVAEVNPKKSIWARIKAWFS